MKRLGAVACAALFLAVAGAASGQTSNSREIFLEGGKVDVDAAKTYVVDTAIPVAPAFALLKAETPQSIGSGFGGDSYFHIGDSSGDLPEVSAAFRPYWLVSKESLDSYLGPNSSSANHKPTWDERLKHIAGRSIVSAALANVGGDTKREGAALGLSTTLLDKADPRTEVRFSECLHELLSYRKTATLTDTEVERVIAELKKNNLLSRHPDLEFVLRKNLKGATATRLGVIGPVSASYDEIVPPEQAPSRANRDDRRSADMLLQGDALAELLATPLADLRSKYDECVDQARKRFQRRGDVTIGAGAFWLGENSDNLDGLNYEGASVWLGYRLPLVGGKAADKNRPDDDLHKRPLLGEVSVYARYESRQKQKFDNNVVSDSDTIVGYAGYSLASENDNWRVSAAVSWNRRDYEASSLKSNEFYRYNASFEFRLPEAAGLKNAWIEFGYGALSERVEKEKDYGFIRLKVDLSKPIK